MRPKNFRTAAAYRLGVVVLKGDIPCPMCTQTIDKLGDHATCCSKAGDLIVRHNNLRNLVDRIAQDGQLNPDGEEGYPWPHVRSRPGDVSFRLWTQGKGLAIDIAVTSRSLRGTFAWKSPARTTRRTQRRYPRLRNHWRNQHHHRVQLSILARLLRTMRSPAFEQQVV